MYKIVKTYSTLTELEKLVQLAMLEGFSPSGSPFFEARASLWCQAMTKPPEPAVTGPIQIREPKARTK